MHRLFETFEHSFGFESSIVRFVSTSVTDANQIRSPRRVQSGSVWQRIATYSFIFVRILGTFLRGCWAAGRIPGGYLRNVIDWFKMIKLLVCSSGLSRRPFKAKVHRNHKSMTVTQNDRTGSMVLNQIQFFNVIDIGCISNFQSN